MKFTFIVEHNNGIYRALIPSLPNLIAEGASRDEAICNAQRAAEDYLSKVEVVTMELKVPEQQAQRYSTIQDLIESAGMFKGDEEAMLEHIEEIYAERRRQREEVERELDAAGPAEAA